MKTPQDLLKYATRNASGELLYDVIELENYAAYRVRRYDPKEKSIAYFDFSIQWYLKQDETLIKRLEQFVDYHERLHNSPLMKALR